MADHYIPFPVIQERVRNVPFAQTVTVTEKRAPTDESIKLYGEMLVPTTSPLTTRTMRPKRTKWC